MTLIEIQDAYIERVTQAYAKITLRTKGDRFGKTRRAARKEAHKRLTKLGYNDYVAAILIRDAHDVFKLNIACDCDD